MFYKTSFVTNDAFIGVFVEGLDSAAIAIVEFQLRYGDQLAIWGINWRFNYDLCDQVAIFLRSERIATDLCASESTDGDLGDHGDQLETNQRSISALGDLSALPGALCALTERRISPPSGMGVLVR